MTMQSSGSGEEVAIPQFDALCANGKTVDQAELRGTVLRIIAMPDQVLPPPALPTIEGVKVRTIILVRHPPISPMPVTCVTMEPEAWSAFAILLGINPDALAGTEILADSDMWLRASWKSEDAGKWQDPHQAVTMIRDIAAHPLAPAAQAAHAHHH
jgi:hypothetical protein